MEKIRIDCVNGNYSMITLRFQGIPLANCLADQYFDDLLKSGLGRGITHPIVRGAPS